MLFTKFNFLFIWTILLHVTQCLHSISRSKRDTSSHIIMKKLTPVEISENVPIGHTIIDMNQNLEPSPTTNDTFYYNFEFINNMNDKYASDVSNILKNYFLLDPVTGKIQTSKYIDLENFCDQHICHGGQENTKKVCSIPFKVKASKANSSYHIVFDLIIKDENEFPPKFNRKHMHLNVTEEFAPVRLPIGSVAYDEDCTDRHALVYSIDLVKINGKLSEEYHVKFGNKSGSNLLGLKVITDPANMLIFLYTSQAFDRELMQNVSLDVIATDRSGKEDSLTGVMRVDINVVDINDNAPRFKEKLYNLEFDEDLPADTELFQLTAYDPDSNLNGQIRYEFTEMVNKDARELFQIDPNSGFLSLKKQLSFDPRSSKNLWQISVRAVDQSLNVGSRKSTIALVNLRVKDINNHRPVIGVNFFHMPSLIEPRMLIKKHLDDPDLNSKEEIIYLASNLPNNSIIGILSITDDDVDWNGQIDDCQLSAVEKKAPPIILEDFSSFQAQPESFVFSSDEFLNKEMKFLFGYFLSTMQSAVEKNNGRRYFIRTASDFIKRDTNYEIELTASDKGTPIRQTSKKQLKLVVLDNEDNLISQNGYDYEDYSSGLEPHPIDVRLRDHIENYLDDYNSVQYYFSKSIYKVFVTEDNKVPLHLASLTANDFEMTSKVTYEILLPNTMSFNQLNLSTNANQLIQCSTNLIKSLTIDPISGVITLNKSLDKTECTDYLFFIKATDAFQERLSSMLNFKVHVTNNMPRFQLTKHVFNLTENIRMEKRVIQLKDNIKIMNFNPNLKFHLDGQATSKWSLDSNRNLLIPSGLDFEKQKHIIFDLVMTQLGNEIDRTKVEINVLDENEYKPVVTGVYANNLGASTDTLNVNKISEDFTYLVTANLTSILALNESFYFDLVRIAAVDSDKNSSEIFYTIFKVQYFQLETTNDGNNSKLKEFNSPQSNQLFLIDSQGRLKINLNHVKKQLSRVVPDVCFFHLKLSDKDFPRPLETDVYLKLILNKHLKSAELRNLEIYLVNKFSNDPKHYLELVFPVPSKSTMRMIKDLFTQTKLPVLIISMLAIVLVLSLGSLFVISVVYSVSICKVFKCRFSDKKKQKYEISSTDPELAKEFDDEETEETEDDDGSDTTDGVDMHSEVGRKGLTSKSRQHGLRIDNGAKILTSILCSNQRCGHESCFAEKGGKKVSSGEKKGKTYRRATGAPVHGNEICNKSMFLDSPIAVKKLLETDNYASQKFYANKYNLEYLFEQNDEYNRRNQTEQQTLLDNSSITFNNNSNKILYSENKNMNLLTADSFKTDSYRSDQSTPVKHLRNQEPKKNTFNQSTRQKKLSFKDPIMNSVNSEHNTNSSSEFDDDYILPGHKDLHSQLKSLKYYDYSHVESNSLMRQQSSVMSQQDYMTYKKAQMQPEENVWVKKMPLIPFPTNVKNSSLLRNHVEVSI